MSTIISLLEADHIDFLKVLNTLEDQAKLVADAREPDRQFIRGVLAYFSGYPRHLHYRREEIILKMLERRAPHLAAKIKVILRYHRTLDARLADLADCFAYFEENQTAGRAAFVTAAIRFAEFEKAHFIDEDKHLFPAAAHVLTAEELSRESTEFPWNSMTDDAALPPLPELIPEVAPDHLASGDCESSRLPAI